MKLSPHEIRVIGALIEKEITTPDQYPLSLNALTLACNQKSNRDPVMKLSEQTVQATVDGLIGKYLVSRQSGYGSRVSKYKHRFCNTDFGELKLSPRDVGILCELMLRGPQTPGELRSRAERLCELRDAEQVEQTLAGLMSREEPLVAKLPREPGKRESRYTHLLGEEVQAEPLDLEPEETEDSLRKDLARLQDRVEHLVHELEALQKKIGLWCGDSEPKAHE